MAPVVPPLQTLTGGEILTALIICGLMGVLGQGVRAVIGLKNASVSATQIGRQAQFSAAYFALSLMIGFIAGIVGGVIVGLKNFVSFNPDDLKELLAIAASGYAGADFIESSLSLVIPGTAPNPSASTSVPTNTNTPAVLSTSVPVAALAAAVPPPSGDAALKAALNIVAPAVNTGTWLAPLSAAFQKFDVNTNRRKAVAIGQFLVEAGSAFQEVVENLNYTHAERLVAVFPNEFADVAAAQPYVNNPVALGNLVYANRLGNGDEGSGDGYRFRGRGLIQLTGRDEYTEFGATIGKSAEDAAAYCETPEGAAMSGCWYLSSRGCLPLADQWQVSVVTRKVNGAAMLGNAQRIAYAEAMLKHLGG